MTDAKEKLAMGQDQIYCHESKKRKNGVEKTPFFLMFNHLQKNRSFREMKAAVLLIFGC